MAVLLIVWAIIYRFLLLLQFIINERRTRFVFSDNVINFFDLLLLFFSLWSFGYHIQVLFRRSVPPHFMQVMFNFLQKFLVDNSWSTATFPGEIQPTPLISSPLPWESSHLRFLYYILVIFFTWAVRSRIIFFIWQIPAFSWKIHPYFAEFIDFTRLGFLRVLRSFKCRGSWTRLMFY